MAWLQHSRKKAGLSIGAAAALAIVAAAMLVQVTAKPAAAAVVAKGAFVHHYVAGGYVCGSNEVMVGVHRSKAKVICAQLNYGYQISNRIIDSIGGTQVSSAPSMHGCPADYLVQGMSPIGNEEGLTCVSLKNAAGELLSLEAGVHDGRGPNDSGTQSTIYGLTPTMHTCDRDLAMRGIHQTQNDLFCAG